MVIVEYGKANPEEAIEGSLPTVHDLGKHQLGLLIEGCCSRTNKPLTSVDSSYLPWLKLDPQQGNKCKD